MTSELVIPELVIPELSLVLLLGPDAPGAAALAGSQFSPAEAVTYGRDAFESVIGARLRDRRLTVVNAAGLGRDARKALLSIGKAHNVPRVAIVLGDSGGPGGASWGGQALRREGFSTVEYTPGADDVTIVRAKLSNDLRDQAGPFDVIGDVHGCRAELESLLEQLGYTITRDDAGRATGARHGSRRAVFVGDLVDRGPDTPGVLRLVMGMVDGGNALGVAGNHEVKLVRSLRSPAVRTSHGTAESLAQLTQEDADFRSAAERFMDGLVSHYVLDGGQLVVAHAGLIEEYHGRASGRERNFCLYGQTTGETDEYGMPVRLPWADDYRGPAMVLYGHTPVPVAAWVNNTMCLDTGCVFGGRLTALRYPEREVVSVPAARMYYRPSAPFLPQQVAQ